MKVELEGEAREQLDVILGFIAENLGRTPVVTWQSIHDRHVKYDYRPSYTDGFKIVIESEFLNKNKEDFCSYCISKHLKAIDSLRKIVLEEVKK